MHEIDDVPELAPRARRPSGLERPGFSERGQRMLDLLLALVVVAFMLGWGQVVAEQLTSGEPPRRLTAAITANPLAPDAPPPAAFLLDAAMRGLTRAEHFRGESGAVRVIVRAPDDTAPVADSLPAGVRLAYRRAADTASLNDTTGLTAHPASPGIWNLMLRARDAIREVPDLSVITLVPLSAKRNGRIGNYLLGTWPYESGGHPRTPAYAPPAGLVRVTRANRDLRVSEHFRLGDFLTKGQAAVWPKYVVLSPRLLDKLELTFDELGRMGHPVRRAGVISGFRTPHYNAVGGNTSGRGQLSRHMYGDAMDIYIDNDGDGRMDDLNGDGAIDIGDGRVIVRAAEHVEREHPSLVGGIGLYAPTGAHAGFVHIDTRGFRARW